MAKPLHPGCVDLINKSTLEERDLTGCALREGLVHGAAPGAAFRWRIRSAGPSPVAPSSWRFETLYDPRAVAGDRPPALGGGIDTPYVEGLRLLDGR